MGVSGIVIWLPSADTTSKERCNQIQLYIKEALGPIIKSTIDAADKCSQNLCSGNGRCVGKIMTCTRRAPSSDDASNHLPSRAYDSDSDVVEMVPMTHAYTSLKVKQPAHGHDSADVCTCQCYEGWMGTDCSKSLTAF